MTRAAPPNPATAPGGEIGVVDGGRAAVQPVTVLDGDVRGNARAVKSLVPLTVVP